MSKILQHELLAHLKNLAIDLGKTPSRDEFIKQLPGSKHGILEHFGSYATLVQAAGLDPVRGKKITNEIFNRNLDHHLEEYKPKLFSINTEPWPDVASISDMHMPFLHKPVEDRFIEYVGDIKPKFVVLNGDAWDMYSHAKFPRSHNVFTPREEEAKARAMNEAFWKRVQVASPKSECIQMLGNHDIRPMKRVLEVYPEAEDWIKERMIKLFTFEGVKTILDPREEVFLSKNVIIFHGYRTKLGDHRDYTLYNTINGHSHVGGVVFRQIRGQTLWELNSGFSGDPYAKGLTYTAQKISNWTWGFGIVNKYGPQFVAL